MNYNFKIDEKNNQLIVDVTVPPRGKLKNPRVTVMKADVLQIVEDAFKPPKGMLVGECLTTRATYVDNYDLNRLEGTWIFSLQKARSAQRGTKSISSKTSCKKKTEK